MYLGLQTKKKSDMAEFRENKPPGSEKKKKCHNKK